MNKRAARIISSILPTKKVRHLVYNFLLHGGCSLLNQKEGIRLYYYLGNNFGDALNVSLLQYFNAPCRYAPVYFADIAAIGSILDDLLLTPAQCRNQRPLHIFGTGFMHDIQEDVQFCRPLQIHALRGKLSQAQCEKIIGESLAHVPLGDPGLLSAHIYPQARAEVKYDVGIICHYSDNADIARANIILDNLSSTYISVEQPPEDFIRAVSQCRFILSSAMHGIICADSLGIPNTPIYLTDKVKGGGFKFRDYYSVYSKATYNPVKLSERKLRDEDILELKDSYAVTQDEVQQICRSLINAFPKIYQPESL